MSKNVSLKLLAFSLFVWAGLSCQAASSEDSIASVKNSIAVTSQTSLTNPDQPFYFFKTTGKHPSLTVGLPGRNEIQTFNFGTVKPNGKVRYVTGFEDFDKLIPIKALWHYGDENLHKEEKYLGWSDKKLEMIADDLLRTYNLLNTKPSERNLFVDVYRKNYPAKMVFKKTSHFKAFKKYLLKTFKLKKVEVPSKKPILVIQFEDGGFELNESDYDFLSTYFEVVDPSNESVKTFFINAQNYQFKMTELFREKSVRIGKKFGQILLGIIQGEKNLHGLKWEKIIGTLLVGSLGTWAVSKAWNGSGVPACKEKTAGKIEIWFTTKDGKPNYTVILGTLGSLIGSYFAMKILKSLLDEDRVYQELLDEYENEEDCKKKEVEEAKEVA